MKVIKELGEGTTIRAVLCEQNGKKVVIKHPRTQDKIKRHLRTSRKEANITQKLPKDLPCAVGVVYVNRTEGRWEISSLYVEGQELTRQLYESLPKDRQEKLIADFAEFLITIHTLPVFRRQEHFSDIVQREPHLLTHYSEAFWFTLTKLKRSWFSLKRLHKNPFTTKKFLREKQRIYTHFQMSAQHRAYIEKTITDISNNQNSFLCSKGICHGDMTPGNMRYDIQTGRLGILDFGSSCYQGNIYTEFGQLCHNFAFGEDFTRLLVAQYNKLAKEHSICISDRKKKLLQVDFEMVRRFAIMHCFQEMIREPRWFDPLQDLFHTVYEATDKGKKER